MVDLIPNAKQQFIDINGKPLVGGTVGTYVVNTLVPKNTWSNIGQTILNTNPIVLDSRGQAEIWGIGVYRQIVRDSRGNLIWDEVTTGNGGETNGWWVTPQDFGAEGNGIKDDTVAIQAAVNTGFPVLFPGALTYRKSSPITYTGKVIIYGNGSTILDDGQGFTFTDSSNSYVENLNFLPATVPFTILRDPAVWTAETADVAQSFDGYIPTTQDTDIWGASSFTATITGSAPTQTMTVSGMSIAPGSTLAVGQPVYYPAGNNPANKIGTISALGTGAGGNGTYTITTTTTQSQSGATMSSGLSSAIQAQVYVRPYQRPGIWFRSTSSTPNTNVKLLNVGGLGSSIVLEGYQQSTVKNCNIAGNTGEGTIYFYNALSYDTTGTHLAYALARGIGNKVLNCNTTFASYCGIAIVGNDNYTISNNSCFLNGESGIKTVPHDGSAELTVDAACTRGVVSGNTCFSNYYDGIDMGTVYGVPGYLPALTVVSGNNASQNRATGITVEGTLGMAVTGNVCMENGTDGINYTGNWGTCSGNYCRANCKFGPTGVNNQWADQQMWDLFVAGDGIASSGNSVVCSYVPYTYPYVHQGPSAQSGIPTVDQEGTDVANSVTGLTTAMFIYTTIPTDQRLQSLTNLKATNGKVDSAATVTITVVNTYVTVVSNVTGLILLRDAAGGVALYTFDPIGGAPVAVTPGTIANLAVQSSGGNFQITVTAGAVPRTISWLALLTQ